jgi:hypothetical protein
MKQENFDIKSVFYNIAYLLIVTIISKEILYINEETLVILCFFLFLFCAFFYGSSLISEFFDNQAQELLDKVSMLFKIQLDILSGMKAVYARILNLDFKLKRLVGFVVKCLEGTNEFFLELMRVGLQRKFLMKLLTVFLVSLETFEETYVSVVKCGLQDSAKVSKHD